MNERPGQRSGSKAATAAASAAMLFRVEQARTRMPWTRAVSIPVLRFIGVAEIVGAISLILPAATGVLPWLTVAAAAGLVTVMVLAMLFHIARHEWPNIVSTWSLARSPRSSCTDGWRSHRSERRAGEAQFT